MSHAPRSLSELELAWLTLFTKLRCAEATAGTHPSNLAASFLSRSLFSLDRASRPRAGQARDDHARWEGDGG